MNPSWIHLGRWFQTRLYHLGDLFLTPLYHLGGSFQTPLYHLHPCRRASMQAYIRVGESAQGEKCDSHLASKSMMYVIDFGGTSLCRAETLIQSKFPKESHLPCCRFAQSRFTTSRQSLQYSLKDFIVFS